MIGKLDEAFISFSYSARHQSPISFFSLSFLDVNRAILLAKFAHELDRRRERVKT